MRLAHMYVPILICTKIGNFLSCGTILRFDANGILPRRHTILSRTHFLGREMQAIAHMGLGSHISLVDAEWLEHSTTCVSDKDSNHLSYTSIITMAFLMFPKDTELSSTVRRLRGAYYFYIVLFFFSKTYSSNGEALTHTSTSTFTS